MSQYKCYHFKGTDSSKLKQLDILFSHVAINCMSCICAEYTCSRIASFLSLRLVLLRGYSPQSLLV